jgi:hypothetical protein
MFILDGDDSLFIISKYTCIVFQLHFWNITRRYIFPLVTWREEACKEIPATLVYNYLRWRVKHLEKTPLSLVKANIFEVYKNLISYTTEREIFHLQKCLGPHNQGFKQRK